MANNYNDRVRTIIREHHVVFNDNDKVKKYFSSYAHEDIDWAKRIEKSLSVLTIKNRIALWIDRSGIGVGARWREKIFEEIDSSDGAILLISDDFLASSFIQTSELPRIFARVEQRGFHLIPVIVRFSHILSRKI
jgi:hypothetical protein